MYYIPSFGWGHCRELSVHGKCAVVICKDFVTCNVYIHRLSCLYIELQCRRGLCLFLDKDNSVYNCMLCIMYYTDGSI